MKKTLSLLLVLLLCSVSLSAMAAPPRISEELIKVTAAGSFSLQIDYQEILTWQVWRDEIGIEFEMSFYNNEDWKTQLNLMLAADDLPDIIFSSTLTDAEVADLGGQGYFANFLDYEELIPNIKQAWEDYPGLRGATTSYDGNIYGTKSIITSTVNKICRAFINERWLSNVGMEAPTTIDELYNVLVAFKEQDANGNGNPDDEIPLGIYKNDMSQTEKLLLAAYGINTDSVQYILQADEGDIFLAETTDVYRDYLRFLRKLCEEGLLDEQFFTLTSQEIMLNCSNDRYGAYATGSAPYVMASSTMEYDKEWLGLMGLTSEHNDVPTLGIPSGISANFGTLISADSPYVEELIQFVDYLHSEEGGTATFSGYEGITFDYEYDELLGIDVLTIYTPEGYESSDEFRQYKAVLNGPFLTYSGIPVRNTIWYDVPLETLQEEAVIEKYGWIAQLSIASRNPDLAHVPTFPSESMSYTEEESEERISLRNDVLTYLEQAKANFVLGNWDIETEWDRYLSELENIGLNQLMEIEQAAWTRYYESN